MASHSSESTATSLRFLGVPCEIDAFTGEECSKLWAGHFLECKDVVGGHDASRGFRCTGSALASAKGSPDFLKGACPCDRFTFLVQQSSFPFNCRCKHNHLAHEATYPHACKQCDIESFAPCAGFCPSYKCHCSHFSEAHSTKFVRAFLPRRHRDWVVSGVRPETAAAAREFQQKPKEYREEVRRAQGLPAEDAPLAADPYTARRFGGRAPPPARIVIKAKNDAAMEKERARYSPDLAEKYEKDKSVREEHRQELRRMIESERRKTMTFQPKTNRPRSFSEPVPDFLLTGLGVPQSEGTKF